MRRLTHLSLVSSLFSLISAQKNTYLSSRDSVPSQIARRSLASRSRVAPLFLLGNNAHSEKVCSRQVKKGSRQGGSPNSKWNNEHSEKALYFLTCSFMFFHFLSFPFISFHFLSFFFYFISFSFFHFLSFSFIFTQELSSLQFMMGKQ